MRIACRLKDRTTEVRTADLQEIDYQADEILYVTDENLDPLLPDSMMPRCVLPAGERYKNLESIERIVTRALELGISRDGRLVGIGGGVICDMTAFAASVYMRGIAVDLIPSTLLSMVDASLGGKTGVDFHGVKNIIGTFYPAQVVTICPRLLSTLSGELYLDGLAEVIKHGLLAGGELHELLSENRQAILERKDESLLERVIMLSIAVKKEVVEADPEERLDLRATLNLGHTFAHALETLSGLQTWSHGRAVAWGIVKALQAGIEMGITDSSYAQEVIGLLAAYGYDTTFRIAPGELEEYMRLISHDKKKRGGKVRFILQEGLGKTILSPLEEDVMRKVLSSSRIS